MNEVADDKVLNYQEKIKQSLKRTREIFEGNDNKYFDVKSQKIKLTSKIISEYSHLIKEKEKEKKKELNEVNNEDELTKIINKTQNDLIKKEENNKLALIIRDEEKDINFENKTKAVMLQEKRKEKVERLKPEFHPNWKLFRVISGFLLL
jgi:hypothetical protein